MTEKAKAEDIICANPDCDIATTGKCVEGFEISKCPHFGHAPAETTEDDTDRELSSRSDVVILPDAGTLEATDVEKLLRAGNTRIIAIIGPSDAGKTSLIATLYDLFQKSPVSGLEFARSLTLHAFEHACHDARAASRRNIPHTQRTPRGQVRFFHLDVGETPVGDVIALAMGDRAGEEYRSAADDPSIASGFPEIQRADSLNLLVDGERLVDSGARHNLRNDTIMMLQALIDSEAIHKGQRLAIILTKIDLVQESEHQARAESDFTSLLARIEELFGHVFSVIQTFRIAASPKTSALPRGTGVPELFAFWLEPAVVAPTLPPAGPMLIRAFARLQPLDELENES